MWRRAQKSKDGREKRSDGGEEDEEDSSTLLTAEEAWLFPLVRLYNRLCGVPELKGFCGL